MNNINMDKAQILSNALPYIQQNYNKIIVVKYGGNAMTDEKIKQAVMSDIILLWLMGIKVVVVHGGGPEIDQLLTKVGKEIEFIGGLRHTDEETLDYVQMVLTGKINKNLVSLIQQKDGNAIGLCGIDGGMIQAKKMESEMSLGYVGEITKINTKPILDVLNNGYIPVIATVGADGKGNIYNINADTTAAKIAKALEADSLILMTDVKGLMRDLHDESSLIQEVEISEVNNLQKKGIISGGMIPKVDCCADAVQNGVEKAVIVDGRRPHSILEEILSDEGVGTKFYQV